ncbi:cytochrome b [Vibrio renipiscarius]|uniref:Cytochrome B561 n=1 Tax=Vibrio renipiscarius TaxID=1461322 RepID=A0A0C2KBT8_9VIBR|nr:cytochrome b [Vibrio renipiscarius]KII79533.1 cytochrome B561 [Vibrio renipiscarius]KII80839.1 cytochrome B561 [Vibrio renipiscarius]
MLNKNTVNPHALSWQTIAFHWLTALMFIAIFSVGWYMVDLPRGPEKGELIGLHKSFGAILLVVAMSRITWRLKEGAIPPAAVVAPWQNILAKAIHGLLMLATLMMPISGIAMSVGGGRGADVFGWYFVAEGDKIQWLQELGGGIHGWSVNIIIAVVVLHVAGALKHHWLDKDNTLSRMLGR